MAAEIDALKVERDELATALSAFSTWVDVSFQALPYFPRLPLGLSHDVPWDEELGEQINPAILKAHEIADAKKRTAIDRLEVERDELLAVTRSMLAMIDNAEWTQAERKARIYQARVAIAKAEEGLNDTQ